MRRKIGKDGLVEDTVAFTPFRKSKVIKFREFLKEIKLLEKSTIKFGDKGYYDAPLMFSWCYDEEIEEGIEEAVTYEVALSGTMRRIHKALENLIGTTFGSYRFYDE